MHRQHPNNPNNVPAHRMLSWGSHSTTGRAGDAAIELPDALRASLRPAAPGRGGRPLGTRGGRKPGAAPANGELASGANDRGEPDAPDFKLAALPVGDGMLRGLAARAPPPRPSAAPRRAGRCCTRRCNDTNATGMGSGAVRSACVCKRGGHSGRHKGKRVSTSNRQEEERRQRRRKQHR